MIAYQFKYVKIGIRKQAGKYPAGAVDPYPAAVVTEIAS